MIISPAGDFTSIGIVETGQLPNEDLLVEARTVHLSTDFKHALGLIGLLCNNGCLAIFDEREVIIKGKRTEKIIMRGGIIPLTKLFMLDINEN